MTTFRRKLGFSFPTASTMSRWMRLPSMLPEPADDP